jgi:hypothetical protein
LLTCRRIVLFAGGKPAGEQQGERETLRHETSVGFGDRATASRAEGAIVRCGNSPEMDDERSGGNSTETRCRYCGSHETAQRSFELRDRGATFQVIVACAPCGAAFVALARN